MKSPSDISDHILLIRLKSIGDVVFTLPAVNAVRDRYPLAKITFLTSRENAALLRGFRAVDEILPLDRARFQSRNPGQILGETFKVLRALRREPFSRVFDFQGYGETAFLSWWTGAPERWGMVYKPGRRWAYTGHSGHTPGAHPAEWNLLLLRTAGLSPGPVRNDYFVPAEDLARARDWFHAQKLATGRPTLFLQPFTSNPGKNWPLEKFLALARRERDVGRQIIFGGGPSERAALEPARADGFAVAAGVPLPVSAGLMQLSSLVLGGDTGLLHLAVAMNKRVLMLMQMNQPGSCHPFQHPEWSLTPPAGKAVAEIEPERVAGAIGRALGGSPMD